MALLGWRQYRMQFVNENFATKSLEPTKCHILDLPAGLRNQIWSEAVVRRFPITAHIDCAAVPQDDNADPDEEVRYLQRRRHSIPPLGRTNKQIRREVLSVFFGENVFRFGYTEATTALVSHLWRAVTRTISSSLLSEHLCQMQLDFETTRRVGNDITSCMFQNGAASIHVEYDGSSAAFKARGCISDTITGLDGACICALEEAVAAHNNSTQFGVHEYGLFGFALAVERDVIPRFTVQRVDFGRGQPGLAEDAGDRCGRCGLP